MHIKIVAQSGTQERDTHSTGGASEDPYGLWSVIYLHYFYGILIVWAIFHINFDCHRHYYEQEGEEEEETDHKACLRAHITLRVSLSLSPSISLFLCV